MKKPQIHEEETIKDLTFCYPFSLAFINSVVINCKFIKPKNLMFHKTKVILCEFIGEQKNVIFDQTEIEDCNFELAELTHIQFTNQTLIRGTTGLPSIKRNYKPRYLGRL